MRIDTALAAAGDWRTVITLQVQLGSEPIANMWLQPARVAGYDFIPLSSSADIAEEAEAMHNCLRTYGRALAHNRSRLWSIRRGEQRVATLEVAAGQPHDPLPNIAQLRGVRNAAVAREVSWATRQWLHAHDLLQIDTGQRKWGAAPLDNATWRAIWRPYWLATRRIPEWLPIAASRGMLNRL